MNGSDCWVRVEKLYHRVNRLTFALDVSKSMLAEDIAPSRLDKAKQIISIDQYKENLVQTHESSCN